ncbi:MAG: ABC transporter ATP-binding protein [Bacilli bacterium]|nr:ABC transporter ATP-binding protein [Bacilli bacterium]MDD4547624.1 ABC transporter ATP-binding protein [Bacilli bacterium]
MNKLIVKDLKYTYQDGQKVNAVLKGVNVEFESGKLYCIIGESGSGKTTLISLISALDDLQEGDILYNNKSIKKIGNSEFRLNYVNIVFQSYNLLTYMTARENVEVAVDFSKVKYDKDYIYKTLERVGIDKEKADRPVLKLSGGEQQRVAVARCIATDEPIIVADEPTGNLDEETEEKIIKIFKELAKNDKIVILVSHSKNVAKHADVVYNIKKGVIDI